jgi:hypothetical protein
MATDKIFTSDEIRKIAMAFIQGSGDMPSTEEITKVVNWAELVIMNAELLQGVLNGDMLVTWDEEKDEPRFLLSEQGEEMVEDLAEESLVEV